MSSKAWLGLKQKGLDRKIYSAAMYYYFPIETLQHKQQQQQQQQLQQRNDRNGNSSSNNNEQLKYLKMLKY